ncbi:MAG: DUF72 domain-containing protein [Gemmatimonadales bacterium]|nr:DUF72 domain-containing protein [Gemmatimonadales bacterium]
MSTWIGTSGYVYPHWRKGGFYPPGLRQADELAWYAGRYRTVEINNPFYRLPEKAAFIRWQEATPADFRFAVKGSRYITHVRRLRDCAEPLALLLEHAAGLGAKLGPLLFQLPPTFQADLPRLEEFLSILPAQQSWVIEFRHPSWHTSTVYDRLGRRGVALCIPVGGAVQPDLVTTGEFAYLRMHTGELPGGGFSPNQLHTWSGRVRGLERAGKTVYVYFNNDMHGHAVRDARSFRELLGVQR